MRGISWKLRVSIISTELVVLVLLLMEEILQQLRYIYINLVNNGIRYISLLSAAWPDWQTTENG